MPVYTHTSCNVGTRTCKAGETAYEPSNQPLDQGSLLIKVKTLPPIVIYVHVIAETTLGLNDQLRVITPVAALIEMLLLDKTSPLIVVKLLEEIVV